MTAIRKPVKRAREMAESRKDRAAESREITQNRELTDEERVDEFRRSFFQSSLPDLPKIPGYHTFWATTQNPRDPIHRRVRLGYEIIQATDIPGWEHLGMKSGDFPGAINVNEMIAMKIPLHLYEAYMRENHHDAPQREEEAIYARAMTEATEQAGQFAKRGGGIKAPVIEAGMEELGKAREVPTFSQDDQFGD
jgi:hypothetical protein